MKRMGPLCGGPEPRHGAKAAAFSAAWPHLVPWIRLSFSFRKGCAVCQTQMCRTSPERVTHAHQHGLSYCDLSDPVDGSLRHPGTGPYGQRLAVSSQPTALAGGGTVLVAG